MLNTTTPGPCGRAASATDWIAATGRGRLRLYEPPTMVERPPMGEDQPGNYASPRQLRRFATPAAYVAELPGAAVCTTDGAVVCDDGTVPVDLLTAWDRTPADHPVWNVNGFDRARHLPGISAVVAARGAADNFAHFLADTLPRIQLIRDTGIAVDHWILSARHHRWQRDALERIGIDADRVHTTTEHPVIRAERLLVPARTGFAPMCAPWARERLRRLLKVDDPPSRSRRVFISRASASRRRLRNEPELTAALARMGFETVDFERLRFDDQFDIIGQSTEIIAVHGAALGHLLHAPEGGRLLEIAPDGEIHAEYWGLAALANWAHHLIPAAAADRTSEAILSDLTVDLDTVIEAAQDEYKPAAYPPAGTPSPAAPEAITAPGSATAHAE